jgi:hypothetical protein
LRSQQPRRLVSPSRRDLLGLLSGLGDHELLLLGGDS